MTYPLVLRSVADGRPSLGKKYWARSPYWHGGKRNVTIECCFGTFVSDYFLLLKVSARLRKLSQKLFEASKGGNVEEVDRLLNVPELDLSLTERKNADSNGPATALMAAALEGRLEVVKLLRVRDDIDVNQENSFGHTALHLAVRSDDLDVAKEVVSCPRADANTQDLSGASPLGEAVKNGSSAMVDLLLSSVADIDPNLSDACGNSPLHYAVSYGHVEIVERLLRHDGVDMGAQEENGQTPLHVAASLGLDVIAGLLLGRSQAEAQVTDRAGNTPLHVASGRGHDLVVDRLLAAGGCDVYKTNGQGETAADLAREAGHESVVIKLLCDNDEGNAMPLPE